MRHRVDVPPHRFRWCPATPPPPISSTPPFSPPRRCLMAMAIRSMASRSTPVPACPSPCPCRNRNADRADARRNTEHRSPSMQMIATANKLYSPNNIALVMIWFSTKTKSSTARPKRRSAGVFWGGGLRLSRARVDRSRHPEPLLIIRFEKRGKNEESGYVAKGSIFIPHSRPFLTQRHVPATRHSHRKLTQNKVALRFFIRYITHRESAYEITNANGPAMSVDVDVDSRRRVGRRGGRTLQDRSRISRPADRTGPGDAERGIRVLTRGMARVRRASTITIPRTASSVRASRGPRPPRTSGAALTPPTRTV